MIGRIKCFFNMHKWLYSGGVIRVNLVSFNASTRTCHVCRRKEYKKYKLFEKSKWIKYEQN